MDLQFDPNIRDLDIINGDFVLINNPSVQNGSVIKDARAFNLRLPAYGIGLETTINSDASKMNYEMNRWKVQVKNDGAKKADFTIIIKNSETTVDINIAY